MKGYWIVSADVTDLDKFKQYAAKTPAVLNKYSGQFLARAGDFTAVEGNGRSRNTIIEFPSYQQALDCWHSAEYQDVRAMRLGGAELDIVIVQGCI